MPQPILRRAWESGITHFDADNIYGSGTCDQITGKHRVGRRGGGVGRTAFRQRCPRS